MQTTRFLFLLNDRDTANLLRFPPTGAKRKRYPALLLQLLDAYLDVTRSCAQLRVSKDMEEELEQAQEEEAETEEQADSDEVVVDEEDSDDSEDDGSGVEEEKGEDEDEDEDEDEKKGQPTRPRTTTLGDLLLRASALRLMLSNAMAVRTCQ
jgi:hypothetical protein